MDFSIFHADYNRLTRLHNPGSAFFCYDQPIIIQGHGTDKLKGVLYHLAPPSAFSAACKTLSALCYRNTILYDTHPTVYNIMILRIGIYLTYTLMLHVPSYSHAHNLYQPINKKRSQRASSIFHDVLYAQLLTLIYDERQVLRKTLFCELQQGFHFLTPDV